MLPFLTSLLFIFCLHLCYHLELSHTKSGGPETEANVHTVVCIFVRGSPVDEPLSTDTQEHADQIAKAVSVSYKSLGRPILTLEEAIEQKSFFSSPKKKTEKVGDPQG